MAFLVVAAVGVVFVLIVIVTVVVVVAVDVKVVVVGKCQDKQASVRPPPSPVFLPSRSASPIRPIFLQSGISVL